MKQFIDIHSHRRQKDGSFRIVSFDTHQFESNIPIDYPFSLGLHPWFIDRQNCAEALNQIANVATDEKLMAIGECGLDNLIQTPLEQQIAWFTPQAELAAKIGKPLIIHCVRAFNELFRVAKTLHGSVPWIIHGFNSKKNIAEQLFAKGFYLSFGKALLTDNSNAVQAFSDAPLSQIFLETDDSNIELEKIYTAATVIKRIEMRVFQAQIRENFERVFLR